MSLLSLNKWFFPPFHVNSDRHLALHMRNCLRIHVLPYKTVVYELRQWLRLTLFLPMPQMMGNNHT